jgi:hypothetical protein
LPRPFPQGKGKVSDPSAGCHCQCIVMVHCLFLNAAEPSDSGCPGSEPCSLPPLLLPTCWRPSCHLFTDCWHKFCSLALTPLVCFQQPQSIPLSASFHFCCLFSGFFWGVVGGSVCPGVLCWFIPRVAEGYSVMLGSHLFLLLKVSQAHLELVASSQHQQQWQREVAVLLYSPCIMAWRSPL